MRRYVGILVAVFCGLHAYAQEAFRFTAAQNQPKLWLENGDTSMSGFAGGLMSPMFNNMDVNLDGIQDIVVNDVMTLKVQVFLGNGDTANPVFTYAPGLDDLFPKLGGFLRIVDFNQDGMPDLFTGTTDIKVYQNDGSPETGHDWTVRRKRMAYTREGAIFDIGVANGDIPSIVDVDGDGDMDVLSFNREGNRVHYYQNVGKEVNDLQFELRSECWGIFEEAGINNDIVLGSSCAGRLLKREAHPGSKLLALDIEGDGDMDILVSDLAFPNVVLLKNWRVETQHPVDTIGEVIEQFPKYDTPIDVPYFPSLSLLDINFDQKSDLVCASNSISPISNGLVWAYTNSRNKGFDFSLSTKFFLQENMIDHGNYAIPALADMDADGDEDLVIGGLNHIDNNPDKSQEALIWLYENVGSNSAPIYDLIEAVQLKDQNRLSSHLSPAFGDLDNDGVTDLVVGNDRGEIIFFKNTAAENEAMNLVQTQVIRLGGVNLHPAVIDFDEDGIQDIVLGSENGRLALFLGTGNLEFEERTEDLGQINTSAFYYSYERDEQQNIIDSSKVFLPSGSSRPVFYDFDANGDIDLLVGSAWGYLYFYPNISRNPDDRYPQDLNCYRNKETALNENKRFGRYVAPYYSEAAGIMVMGNQQGGVETFDGKAYPVDISHVSTAQTFRVYPNPATTHIQVDWSVQPDHVAQLNIYSVQGQLLAQHRITQPNQILHLPQTRHKVLLLEIRQQSECEFVKLLVR